MNISVLCGDCHGDRLRGTRAKLLQERHDGASVGDFIVQHDDVAALHLADNRFHNHDIVRDALLASRRHR